MVVELQGSVLTGHVEQMDQLFPLVVFGDIRSQKVLCQFFWRKLKFWRLDALAVLFLSQIEGQIISCDDRLLDVLIQSLFDHSLSKNGLARPFLIFLFIVSDKLVLLVVNVFLDIVQCFQVIGLVEQGLDAVADFELVSVFDREFFQFLF